MSGKSKLLSCASAPTRRPLRHLVALVAMGGAAFAGGVGTSALAQKAAPARSVDLFMRQANSLHANTCAPLYATLGKLAVVGTSYSLRTQADRAAPGAQGMQGTAGMTYDLPDLKGQAAALVSAAPVGNRCEGQFVRVVPFQVSCAEAFRSFPNGSKPIGTLSGVPLYDLGSNRGQAMMITSGATCVVVSIVQGQQKL